MELSRDTHKYGSQFQLSHWTQTTVSKVVCVQESSAFLIPAHLYRLVVSHKCVSQAYMVHPLILRALMSSNGEADTEQLMSEFFVLFFFYCEASFKGHFPSVITRAL